MALTGRGHMIHQFSQVPSVSLPRSTFDRSHGLKTTFNEGQLIPIYYDEVLPGDTFSLNCNFFGRLATPLHPIMDNMYLDSFYFFVPNRLLWTNFKKFFGEQDNPADSVSFLVPTVSAPVAGFAELSLYDYLGVPTKVNGLTIDAFWTRAYNLIWNQWFRDQNLQNSVVVDQGDGPDTYTNYIVLNRGKRHDYFTSCLPFPQKGPAVSIPLGTQAVVKTANAGFIPPPTFPMVMGAAGTGVAPAAGTVLQHFGAGGQVGAGTGAGPPATGIAPQNLYADLSTATSATINQLRQAFAVQQVYERDARGGTRYTELVLSHFGVHSPDARLQRSEYLGGGSVPFNVNPIAQTSATGVTGGGTPQGNLAAMGTIHSGGNGFTKSFTEHGILLGLVSLRADLNYQEGLERMWSRQTRFDFYWPALANIGEQSVLNKEIYAVGAAVVGQDNLVFGYQERWAEYRYKPNKITGQFRSNSATPLDTWHLAQHFTALPLLNNAFIIENPPVSRIVAVPSEPHVLLDCWFNLRVARPLPTYSVPGLTRM